MVLTTDSPEQCYILCVCACVRACVRACVIFYPYCSTDFCSPPCENGGTCIDGFCDCPVGHIGSHCQRYGKCYVLWTHLSMLVDNVFDCVCVCACVCVHVCVRACVRVCHIIADFTLTVPQIPAPRPVRMVVPVIMVSVTVLMSTMEVTANTLILVGVVMVTKFKFLSHHVNPLSLQV